MSPRVRDRLKARVATRMMSKMNRDERIVRVLLGAKVEDIPKRLLLVSTPYVKERACSKLTRIRVSGRVTVGDIGKLRLGIVDIGIGTPSASMMMEAIVRTKPEALVRAELCGGLEKEHRIGDIFVASGAIVGDGSGIAYFGSEEVVTPHQPLTNLAIEILQGRGRTVHQGSIWTTDILMKQTSALLGGWAQKGASAVDMESTAILGIAGLEDVPAASLNCISDLPLHGPGPFEMDSVDPEFLSGTDDVVETGLWTLVSWTGN